jgi:hypothetical protein
MYFTAFNHNLLAPHATTRGFLHLFPGVSGEARQPVCPERADNISAAFNSGTRVLRPCPAIYRPTLVTARPG